VDQVTSLKHSIDEAGFEIEQQEALSAKLQNELIEWDAHKKLCRRDAELNEIEEELKVFSKDVSKEQTDIK
jgi:hypothetical protein